MSSSSTKELELNTAEEKSAKIKEKVSIDQSDKDSMVNVNSSTFRLILLILMVVQNSSVVLLGRYSRASVSKDDLYVVNHLIVITEFMKFVFANVLEYYTTNGNLVNSIKIHIFNKPLDCLKIMIPSLLYLLQNSLLYVALSNLSAPIFQVTYQSKLLTTAVVSVIMLNRKYNVKQWLCLTVLGIGVAIVVLGKTSGSSSDDEEDDDGSDKPAQSFGKGMFAVSIACLSSALAGVYFEKVLKKTSTSADATQQPASLWMRNIQMAFISVVIGTIQYMNLKNEDAVKPFLHGFSTCVWCVALLQAGGGLLVAAVIKYADNVLKGMATGVSVVTSTALSMLFFGTPLTMSFFNGSCLILFSVYFFSNDIPCVKPLPKEKTSDAGDVELQKPLVKK
mmetsp:Transcript_7314/g.10460  ORF Transcript_7314/g.10460 Transcript_7314/m.10460 type:complete len:393 (+) Transcript_7314:42-1220(+)